MGFAAKWFRRSNSKIRTFGTASSDKAARRRGRRSSMRIEPLEDRNLLAINPFDLSQLQTANGGNGSAGIVYNGFQNIGDPGSAVGTAGDVNNDGFDDFLIGAPGSADDGNPGFSGQVFVVFGSAKGIEAEISLETLDGTNGFTIAGIDGFDNAGASVASAGDINGDNYDDIILGAPPADKNEANIFQDEGQVFVIYGGATGSFTEVIELSDLLPTNGGDGSVGFVINGITNADKAGTSVSSAGDFNNDGFDDMLIGAPDAAGGNGEAYLLYGKSAAFDAEIELHTLLPPFGDGTAGILIGNHISDVHSFGDSVSPAGDVNDDGYGDLLIGAPGDAFDTAGAAFVVFGQQDYPAATFDVAALQSIYGGDGSLGFIIHGAADGHKAGDSVSGAGDANADGFDDLVIGAPGAEVSGFDAKGETYVLFGSDAIGAEFDLADLLPPTGNGSEGLVIRGIDFGDDSGMTVSVAGDVNGDGNDDVIIGARAAGTAGEAYLLFGADGSFPAVLELSTLNGVNGTLFNGIDADEDAGASVSTAGDVNNDGLADLLIGAPDARPDTFAGGRTYLVYGSTEFGSTGGDLDAVNDSDNTTQGVAVDISVLDNDDPSGLVEIVDFTQPTPPTDGTVTDNGDGTLNFDPDPTLTGQTSFDYTIRLEQIELNASDPALADWFGYDVAIAGDYAVVGAKLDDDDGNTSGAAYLYQRTGNTWTEIKKLTAGDAAAGDNFGQSVAIDGNTIVVGAWLEDSNGANAGSAYVFERDQGGADNWGEVTKIIGSETTGSDKFGFSVAIDQDTIVVGAPEDDPTASAAGAVYVFDRDEGGAGNWGEVAALAASDGAGADKFGHAVAIDGYTIVVGAYLANAAGTDSGTAYVFERDPAPMSAWLEITEITPADAVANDHFGYSVDISGDTIAVGAWLDDYDQGAFKSNAGSVYVFGRNEGGADNWGEVAKSFADDPAAGDRLGASVALDVDQFVAGAQFADGAFADAGAVYHYQQDQGGVDAWGQVQKLTADDAITNDNYGISAAIDGDEILVGALAGDSTVNNSGTAYVNDLGRATATVTVDVSMAMLLAGGGALRAPQTAPLVAELPYVAADAAFGNEGTSDDEVSVAPHVKSEFSATDMIDEVDKAFALPDDGGQETDDVLRFDWLTRFARYRLSSREIGAVFARPLWLDDGDA